MTCYTCGYGDVNEFGDITCGYGPGCFRNQPDRILEEKEYGDYDGDQEDEN